jgi:hypothetical protein
MNKFIIIKLFLICIFIKESFSLFDINNNINNNINIKIINPTNLSIVSNSTISIEANLYGELSSNLDYKYLLFCIYDASYNEFNVNNILKEYDGFPNYMHQCLSLLEPINNIINRTNKIEVYYNPGSIRFKSILLNMNVINNNYNNKYNDDDIIIICEDTVYFDSIYSSNENDMYIQPVSKSLVDLYREDLIFNNNIEIINVKSKSSFHIVIFFIDFQIHGCNMRLVNFGCQNLQDIIKVIKKDNLIDIESNINIIIEFLVAAEEGLLLDSLLSCNSNATIRIIPSLFVDNIKSDIDNEYYINNELVSYLSTIDVLITG